MVALKEDPGITLNMLAPLPEEEKYIVLAGVDRREAVEMALQCRKTHPDEPIELIPTGDRWNVVRVVVKNG